MSSILTCQHRLFRFRSQAINVHLLVMQFDQVWLTSFSRPSEKHSFSAKFLLDPMFTSIFRAINWVDLMFMFSGREKCSCRIIVERDLPLFKNSLQSRCSSLWLTKRYSMPMRIEFIIKLLTLKFFSTELQRKNVPLKSAPKEKHDRGRTVLQVTVRKKNEKIVSWKKIQRNRNQKRTMRSNMCTNQMKNL